MVAQLMFISGYSTGFLVACLAVSLLWRVYDR